MLRFIDEDIMRTHALLNMLKAQKSKLSEEKKLEETKPTPASNVCDVGVQAETVEESTLPKKSLPTRVQTIKFNMAEKIPKNVQFIKSQFKGGRNVFHSDPDNIEEIHKVITCNEDKTTNKKSSSERIFRSIATETEETVDRFEENEVLLTDPSYNINLDETIYLNLPDQIHYPKDILTGNMEHYVKCHNVNNQPVQDDASFELNLEEPQGQEQWDKDLTFTSANDMTLFRTLPANPINTSTPREATQNQTETIDVSSMFQSFASNDASINSPGATEFDRDKFWKSVARQAGVNETMLFH